MTLPGTSYNRRRFRRRVRNALADLTGAFLFGLSTMTLGWLLKERQIERTTGGWEYVPKEKR